MAPTPLQQRRIHNTLLFQKLLNLRDGASPFTLVLDTLEQSGAPVMRDIVRRAQISKTKIIHISYATLRRKLSFPADVFISARSKTLSNLRKEIVSHLPAPGPPPSSSTNAPKYLLIIDTLTPLSVRYPEHLSTFLSSLLISPQISLLATYHTDIPIPYSSSTYQPSPLTTLLYLSTAILTISSLHHVLAAKKASDKSLHPPSFGLDERKEGVIVASKRENESERGVVVEMELRRKSGRGVIETFVLSPGSSKDIGMKAGLAQIVLLDEHASYAPPVLDDVLVDGKRGGEDDEEGTFSLQLTDKQRRDREGVVLPYFDAQSEGGVGDGGRILYEMGEEDREDFDDEEDEI